MKRKFVSNLILLLAVNLLVKPFYILGVEAEIQNRVGAEVYGNYFALISFSFLLNILLDLGITNFNTKEIAQNQQLLQKHFGGILALRFLLFILYGLALLGCGLFLGYSNYQMGILAILGINQGLAAFVLYFRSNLTALHRFRADRFLSVLDRLILITLMSALLWGDITQGSFHIEWFVYGQTVAYSITVLTGFILVLFQAKKVRFKFEWPFMVAILKKSFPYALLVLLMAVYFRTDSVMLERLHLNGAFEAGIYAMAFRFFEAANQVAFLFGILLLPIFSRMIKIGEEIQPVVSLSFKILISGALILAAVCFSLPDEILSMRYTHHSELAAPVFGLLMLGFVFVCCTYIFGTLLTANGSLKRLNQIALGGVLLNICLNALLIPNYGAWGCALASCVTLGLVALLQMIQVQRVFSFNITRGFRKSLLIFLAIITLMVMLSYVVEANWKLKLFSMLILGVVSALATGLLHFGRFMNLIKQSKN